MYQPELRKIDQWKYELHRLLATPRKIHPKINWKANDYEVKVGPMGKIPPSMGS
jgi:hypothetical protein